MNTYAVQTVAIKTGAVTALLGNIAATSEAAALACAAELMGFCDAADMIQDYASNTYCAQDVRATATDAVASYTAE